MLAVPDPENSKRSPVRRLAAVLAATATIAAAAATPASAQPGGFVDVPEDAYYSAPVDELAQRGVFASTECDAGFCPHDPADRSTIAVWLVRVLDGDDPETVTQTRFDDVEADSSHAAFIERLAELEVTVGCKQDPLRYCPDGLVTRAQIASFLVRAFDLEPAEPAGFADIEGSAHEANIDALAAAGLTVGCKQDPLRYCPDRPVTRAQMATFLSRALALADPDPDTWTPPTAQVIPEVVPLCSTDRATWADGACTPPGTWITGTYSPGSWSYEVPRAVAGLAEFVNACNAVREAPCRGMLARMKWPIDYLGARPSCIVSEYTRRLDHFARTHDFASGAVTERFGWHHCVTATDPPVAGAALAGDGNDVGVRLSDTGVTLSERCRLVLPENVQLETKVSRPFTRFEAGHAGCDAWAAWIEEAIATPRRGVSKKPTCWRSTNLAQEWMEHHHGVPEDYPGFGGC